jgi:hypothetical protein
MKCGVVTQATDANINRRMRFARCITKATYTHSQYVIPIAFRRQQWLHGRTSMLRYTYIACLLYLSLGAFDEIREAREVDSARRHCAF